MTPDNVIDKPDISGVSEEIQNTIISDLQTAPEEKTHHSFLGNKKIGISVSDNEDLEELGYSQIHLRDLMIEIVRNILINGGSIVYGGNIDKEGYTNLFSDLAFQYRDKKESKKVYFENYFAFPIYCLLTEQDEAHFKKHRSRIIKVPPPVDIDSNTETYLPSDTVEAKLIWSRSLSQMRKIMIQNSYARILAGGKVSNYTGKMPGLIEEARIALEQQKPLYLIGALGGACRQIINSLSGKSLDYFMNPFHQSDQYKEFQSAYNKSGNDQIDPEIDSNFFRNFGVRKLSDLNGLTKEENERLFVTTNLPEILYYVFKGLMNVSGKTVKFD